MKFLLKIIGFFACFILAQAEKPLSKIRIRKKWFVDDSDRVVLFRGINAVRKEEPWTPNDPRVDLTNVTQLINLKRWGFNTVRLGLIWSGLMPFKNFINYTYLDEMERIVQKLASLDIYVIIDLHQDMMSSKFGSYDAVPLWLLQSMPQSKFSFPWPLKNNTLNASVFAAYITESCGFAFQCLYKNVNDFSEYFEEYWSIVSKRFSNFSSVLGYELINEPWAGDVYANPLLFLPSYAGKHNLLPFYDRAYQAIRKNDPETLVFYEPVTWGVLFNKNYFGTGFNRAPGNDSARTVLSWHYYCWILNFTPNPIVNGTYPKFDKIVCDDIQLTASFEAVKFDMAQLGGGPSFLTEFGECSFADAKQPDQLNTDECEYILNANDKYLESWTYWDSYFYDSHDFQVNSKLVSIFSRVYPRAVDGIPQKLFYNSTDKQFLFIYETNLTKLNTEEKRAPTEIFVPEHAYPNGFLVKTSSHLTWSFDLLNRLVLLEFKHGLINEPLFLTSLISIFPR